MSRKTLYLLLAYIIFVSGVIYYFLYDRAYDDPFITYRYARNLAQGAGFTYNEGARVLSTTTPLFTLFLAAFYRLWPNLPALASLIGAVSLALGGIFIWDLARSWQSPGVGWVGLLLYPTFPWLLITLGSETPLYLALALGAFAFYARDKLNWAAVFAALVVLARPDGILVPAILCVDYLVRQRRLLPWKPVGIFLALTLSWVVFALLYFGTPIPVTLLAKQHQGAMTISEKFAPGLINKLFLPAAGQWFIQIEAFLAALGLLYLVIQIIFGSSDRSKLIRRWSLVLLWVALYYLVYTWLGVSSYFWYYAPVITGLLICVGLGVDAIQVGISGLLQRIRFPLRMGLEGTTGNRISYTAALILLSVLAIANLGAMVKLSHNPDRRIPVYRVVGEWIRENTAADATVGALEVGALGYYSHRIMVDFAGLIQPDVATFINQTTTYADSANWALDHYRPDVVVVHEGFLPERPTDYLARQCREAQRFLGAPYQYSENMIVYFCR